MPKSRHPRARGPNVAEVPLQFEITTVGKSDPSRAAERIEQAARCLERMGFVVRASADSRRVRASIDLRQLERLSAGGSTGRSPTGPYVESVRESATSLPSDRSASMRLVPGGEGAEGAGGKASAAPDRSAEEQLADAIAQTQVKYRALIDASLTVERVAARLGVNSSRIRQRLGKDGDLYGFKVSGEWRVPGFFFDRDGRIIPNIEKVARTLPVGLHPLGVRNWFMRPHPDLYLDDDDTRDLSPLEWLATGQDPGKLAELAAMVGIV